MFVCLFNQYLSFIILRELLFIPGYIPFIHWKFAFKNIFRILTNQHCFTFFSTKFFSADLVLIHALSWWALYPASVNPIISSAIPIIVTCILSLYPYPSPEFSQSFPIVSIWTDARRELHESTLKDWFFLFFVYLGIVIFLKQYWFWFSGLGYVVNYPIDDKNICFTVFLFPTTRLTVRDILVYFRKICVIN